MNNPQPKSPLWDDYELIDCGDFEKLERFGRQITVRPEPQAVFHRSMSDQEWEQTATAIFRRETNSDERGKWIIKQGAPEQWTVSYPIGKQTLKMRLGLTSFKHVGLFPEQADNWLFATSAITAIKANGTPRPRVLNLFAYTGGATLAAAAAEADVTHVDSVKQVVNWARENMENSGLDNIRWIVDDALKFARREVKRGKKYNGIILDPPAYGRGPEGEKWVLEENMAELLELCSALIEPKGFLILNLYSMGLSALIAKSAVNQLFPKPLHEEFGELYFTDRFGKMLPLGVYYRFRNL